MLSNVTPSRLRLSRKVAHRRQLLPYMNYAASPLPHAQPSTDVHSFRDNWSGPRGYGARHRLDDAPFSLWDSEKHDFRLPTPSETAWLRFRFQPTSISFYFPVMVIETDQPPNPLPLTVGAMAVSFVSPPQPIIRNSMGMRTIPVQYVRPLSVTTNYSGRRKPEDPLSFQFEKWTRPTDKQLRIFADVLFMICNPRRVHVLCPYLIVELRTDDQRVYNPGSLPRIIGGFSVFYHHDDESVFERLTIGGRERIIEPDSTVEDTSDYLSAFNELSPEVRLESAQATNVGEFAEVSMSTTAGVLIRDNHGQERLTVSNHGFLCGKEVFHPSNTGRHIGEIDERWEALDIALVKLNPKVHFSNITYFEANGPTRLLRSQEIPLGAFFCVDGMSTGAVFMQAHGVTLDFPPRPTGMTGIRFIQMNIFRGFGAMGAVPRDSICGAPIVEEGLDRGGIAGFFQIGNADYALSPCLDELIDGSWGLV